MHSSRSVEGRQNRGHSVTTDGLPDFSGLRGARNSANRVFVRNARDSACYSSHVPFSSWTPTRGCGVMAEAVG